MELGKKIRQLRIKAGLTQEQLEQEWGFTEETDSAITAAKRDQARLLAKA